MSQVYRNLHTRVHFIEAHSRGENNSLSHAALRDPPTTEIPPTSRLRRHSFVANAIKISLPLAKLSLRRQIKSLNDPGEGNLRRFVHLADAACGIRFKETQAERLARHEGSTNVTDVSALGGKLLTCFDRCLLRGGQLLHFYS